MTAIPGTLPQEFNTISDRLNDVGAKFRTVRILRALAKTVAILVPTGAAMVALAGFVALPRLGRCRQYDAIFRGRLGGVCVM